MRRRALVLALVLAGCSSEGDVLPPAAARLIARAPIGTIAPPGTLVVGGTVSTVSVAAAPALGFDVERELEHEIVLEGTSPAIPELFLFRDGSYVGHATGTPELSSARLVRFLPPGHYEVRATEWERHAYEARVSLRVLEPLPPAGELAPGGAPVEVRVPAGTVDRDSAAEVTLVVPEGLPADVEIQLDARSTDCDAQLLVLEGGSPLASDSDGGEGNDASLVRALVPGRYVVRVFDWVHRACTITVAASVVP